MSTKSCSECLSQAIAKLEPSESDRKMAVDCHRAIREALDQEGMTQKTFLTGSYARRTAINPFHDVDIFMVVAPNGDRTTNAQSVLNQVDAMLKKVLVPLKFLKSVKLRRQRRSVGVSFSNTGITFDIVPAISKDGGYRIADRKLDGWIYTNPEVALQKVKDANKASGGKLVPLIKVAKAWNLKVAEAENKKDERGDLIKPFKSFHLEVLCYDFKFAEPYNLREGVMGLFQHLSANWKKELYPPGGGGSLRAYLHKSGADKHPHNLADLLANAARLATDACSCEEGNPAQAHTKWGKLLGTVYVH